MYLHDPKCKVLYFSVFDHNFCGKHDVPLYCVDETNSIDVHEVTKNGDLLVLIKYVFSNNCYLNRLQMLCLLGVVCWAHIYTQPVQHLLAGLEGSAGCYYRLNEGFALLVDRCCDKIDFCNQPFYVPGVVSFLLVLHLWYGRMLVINHDVRVFFIH